MTTTTTVKTFFIRAERSRAARARASRSAAALMRASRCSADSFCFPLYVEPMLPPKLSSNLDDAGDIARHLDIDIPSILFVADLPFCTAR